MKIANVFLVIVVSIFVFAGCQGKGSNTPTSSTLRSIYFNYDESLIRSDMVGAMQGNAGYLKGSSNISITIEGNCDNRGTNEYNLALGHRRANAAKDYMMNLGVGANSMRTVSYGEERPVCTQNSDDCWQKNRRDDFRRN